MELYPEEFISRKIAEDIEYDPDKDTLNYSLDHDSGRYDWIHHFGCNIYYKTVDLFLSPLTGYDKRLSGYIVAEGVSLAADRKIEEHTPEKAVISNESWDREIENPEWHEIAETMLNASNDVYELPNRFKRSYQHFLDVHR